MIAIVNRIQGARALAATLIIALAGLTVVGCGGKEEPAPAPEQSTVSESVEATVDAVQEAAEETVETIAEFVLPDGAPVTLSALRLMPAEAQMAIGVPPLNALLDQIVPIANRVWGEEEVADEIRKFTSDIAGNAGAPDAETIQEVAEAKGIDPEAPLAVFGDFTSVADSFAAFAEENADLSDEEREAAMEEFEPEIPGWALVVGIADREKAEAAIQDDLIATIPEVATADHTTENVAGNEIQIHGDYGYFLTDDQAVLGSTAMVKAAAARLSDPATFRYGTDACPAAQENEIVALAYANRAHPLMVRILESLEGNEELDAALQMQLAMMEEVFASDSDDPIVTTLGANDEKVALSMRIDTAEHANMLAYAGEATPLRLAGLLPEHTLAMLSYRLSDELKTYINDIVFPAAVESMGDDGTKQGVAMAKQGIGMIGDELTIGITGVRDDFPEAYVMLALAEPEQTSGLLKMLVPSMPGETYAPEGGEEVEISSIAAPIPIPLSIAYPGDMVLVSNNTDGMKKIIDLMQAGETSGMFAKVDPPLDPDVPRYNGLLFNSQLVEDLMPVIMLAGGDVRDAQPVIEQVVPVVREVRAFSEMHGTWNVTDFTIYLKDPA